MNDVTVWKDNAMIIVDNNQLKGNIKTNIPGRSVDFDRFIKDCYSKDCPASADSMFILHEKTMYVEFKTYSRSDEDNDKIDKQICKKICDTAVIHYHFLSKFRKLPEEATFWIVTENARDEILATMGRAAGTGLSRPAIFNKFAYTDNDGNSLYYGAL